MHAVASFHPFDQKRIPFDVKPGMSLHAVALAAVAAMAESENRPTSDYGWFFEVGIIRVNGKKFDREFWSITKPKKGAFIDLVIPANKGKIGKIALILATIAIAAATAFVAPVISAQLLAAGFSATAASLGGSIGAALIGIGGQLLLKALTPSPSIPNLGGEAAASLSQAGIRQNQMSIGQTLPGIIGRIRFSPPPLMPAYTTLEDGVIWAHAIVGTMGRNLVEDIKINGVGIEAFPLAEYEVYEGNGLGTISFLSSYTYVQNIPSFEFSTFKIKTELDDGYYLRTQSVPEDSAPQWHRLVKKSGSSELWVRIVFDGGIANDLGDAHVVPFRLRFRKRGDVAWRNGPELHIKDIKISGPFQQEFKVKWKIPEEGVWVCRNDSLNCHVALKKSAYSSGSDWLADAYFTQTALPATAIPTMTSATTSGVTVSGSSTFGAGNEPWKAADGDSATYWRPTNSSLPATWQVDFGAGNEKTIRSMTISHTNWDGTAPADFVLSGSSDGSSWTSLVSYSVAAVKGDRNVQLATVGAYRFYKVVVSANNGAASSELRIYGIRLSEQNSVSSTINSSSAYVTQFSEGARYVSLNGDGATIWLDPADWPSGEYDFEIKRGLAYLASDVSFDTVAGAYATNRWNCAGSANNFHFFNYYSTVKGPPQYLITYPQGKVQSRCQMSVGTAVYYERPIRSEVEGRLTRIALRLPGLVADSISAIFTGYAREWNGSTWNTEPTPTRNNAAYYRDALLLVDKRAEPLPGEIIQDSTLQNFYDHCEANGFTCDAIIQGMVISDVLSILASCARAAPRQSDMWGVTIDQDRSSALIRGVFTPENSKDLGTEVSFPDVPDALLVSYVDEDDDWVEKEVLVYNDGITAETAGLIEKERYTGISSSAKATATALYNMRQMTYRRIEYRREVFLEGLTYAKGDLVLLQDEVIDRHAFYGLIKSIVVSGLNVVGLELYSIQRLSRSATDISTAVDIDAVPDIDAYTTTFAASVRLRDGTVQTIQITDTADTSTITFTTPVVNTSQFSTGLEVLIGPVGRVATRAVIRSIEHAGGERFRLFMVPEANEIFE